MTTKHTLQDEFTKWFTANYPPNCVISRPEWHAPKIWRAARVPDLIAENERLLAANTRLAFVAAAAEALLKKEPKLSDRWAWLEFRALEATLEAALKGD